MKIQIIVYIFVFSCLTGRKNDDTLISHHLTKMKDKDILGSYKNFNSYSHYYQ